MLCAAKRWAQTFLNTIGEIPDMSHERAPHGTKAAFAEARPELALSEVEGGAQNP